jgi:hypothetical protein
VIRSGGRRPRRSADTSRTPHTGVNAQVFWKYEAFIDSVRRRCRSGRVTAALAGRLYGLQNRAAEFGAADPPAIITTVLGAIADPRDGVDEQTRNLVKQFLLRKKTLDPAILAPLNPAPMLVSLFTTAIVDVAKFQLAEGRDGTLMGSLPGNDRQYLIRKQVIDALPTTLPRIVLPFFREVFTQLCAAHPAVLPFVG